MNRAVIPARQRWYFLWSPGIDFKESIMSAYVGWRAGTTTLFQLESIAPRDCSKIPAQAVKFTADRNHL
jgi:hypothetical protein